MVQRGIAIIVKKVNVSSSAAKGESRGVIEDKTRFLEKERGFFGDWWAGQMAKSNI